jgi:hypothetical protein
VVAVAVGAGGGVAEVVGTVVVLIVRGFGGSVD